MRAEGLCKIKGKLGGIDMTKTVFSLLVAGLCVFGAQDAFARTKVTKAFIDTVQFLDLPADAATVVQASPDVLHVQMETPRRYHLRGLRVGKTGLTFFDKNRNVILDTTVVVAPSGSTDVTTVERVCQGSNCVSEEKLICMDECIAFHEDTKGQPPVPAFESSVPPESSSAPTTSGSTSGSASQSSSSD